MFVLITCHFIIVYICLPYRRIVVFRNCRIPYRRTGIAVSVLRRARAQAEESGVRGVAGPQPPAKYRDGSVPVRRVVPFVIAISSALA